jgi:hypothetical protein
MALGQVGVAEGGGVAHGGVDGEVEQIADAADVAAGEPMLRTATDSMDSSAQADSTCVGYLDATSGIPKGRQSIDAGRRTPTRVVTRRHQGAKSQSELPAIGTRSELERSS